jgi:two-component system chemotaxis response regulator CheY
MQISSSVFALQKRYRNGDRRFHEPEILGMQVNKPNTYVALDALKVGIVEDNAYFRRLVRAMLGGLGIRQISEATTLAGGWDIVLRNRPDVLFLDWNLDGDDGIGLLDRIRCHPDDYVATLAVVFLSAHTDKRHVLHAARLGANDFIVKPVSARVLYERLRRLTQTRFTYYRRAGRLVPVAGSVAPTAPAELPPVSAKDAGVLFI